MSAITVSAMPLSEARAAASQATSSTPPPAGTRCDQRCTHADGASAECGEGALIRQPPCCALRYSPWERPCGSCRVLLVQRLERHAIDHAGRDQLEPST